MGKTCVRAQGVLGSLLGVSYMGSKAFAIL